jgi:hypothetical protein
MYAAQSIEFLSKVSGAACPKEKIIFDYFLTAPHNPQSNKRR